ncbi:MAG: nicotinate (nicotinamide) nucleotide adenylyltransferase [Clostridia bacterium]|nr:nicotinate (nicotinamide) nucleotide adenylyltransferase [Clostridia bacterium]
MNIAIFGGAFNPVHREHVNLARAAVEELKLDKIIIMPTAVSPHKSGRPMANFWQRYEMCRAAFSCIPQAEVSNFELTRGGVSYTYLTCEHFADLYPGARRYFLIGADMLDDFLSWKNPQKILNCFSLAACGREDMTYFNDYKNAVEQRFGEHVAVIPYVGERVSSTQIRTLAALGEDISAYVNADVCRYIKENNLYALKNLWGVKDMITATRWAHTVRVAVMCAKNASRADICEEQAITMAALHDCAKYLPADSPYLKGFTPPDCAEAVLHQYSGAYVAKNTFGIDDEVILSAIACHATGKENMSKADMLLYLCDMLEDGRAFEGVDGLRKAFDKDLKQGMLAALSHQLTYLSSLNKPIDEATKRAYNYLKEN